MEIHYPSYRVVEYFDHKHYYLVASPTNCVVFAEVRNANNNFGFEIQTLSSRAPVKVRIENSEEMDRDCWFAEVKASMMAHLDAAMQLSALCDVVRYLKPNPKLSDFAEVNAESKMGFDHVKRATTLQLLGSEGLAINRRDATLMLNDK